MLQVILAIDMDEEREFFIASYRRYSGLMLLIARRMLVNEQDAEDAVSMAFESAIKSGKRLSFDSEDKVRAFFLTVVRRKALDLARKRKASVPFDPMEAEVCLPEDSGQLAEALARLPARYREALILRYADGFETHELAAMLSMKRGAVQKLIYRAKKALEAELGKDGEA